MRDTDKVSSASGPGFWYFVKSERKREGGREWEEAVGLILVGVVTPVTDHTRKSRLPLPRKRCWPLQEIRFVREQCSLQKDREISVVVVNFKRSLVRVISRVSFEKVNSKVANAEDRVCKIYHNHVMYRRFISKFFAFCSMIDILH